MFRAAQGVAAEGGEAQPGPYNVILISVTNTRWDHLGLYGYKRNTSPNLDRFAKRCLVFRNAFSHASWTLPVVMSLFTSQYPFTHGLMNREEERRLAESTPTLVDALRRVGYQTAAFVGGRDYDPKFGHVSRFQTVQDAVRRPEEGDWKQYGVLANTVPPARAWLRQNARQRFFLLVQGYDTHCPFAVPKLNDRFDPNYRGTIDFTKCYWTFERTRPVRVRAVSGEYEQVYVLKTKPGEGEDAEVLFRPRDVTHMEALYDGEIFDADDWVGQLLGEVEALGLLERTVVVIYSDHGDMFGKHGRFMRGGPLRGTFYDDVLHIPLLIYHPALAPRPVEGLVQVVDLAPTLLEWLGVTVPTTFHGASLVPLLQEGRSINPYAFAGSRFTPAEQNPFFRHSSVILAARDLRWKLIREHLFLGPGAQEEMELYDLAKDPQELTNVASRYPDVVREFKTALDQWLKRIGAEPFGKP